MKVFNTYVFMQGRSAEVALVVRFLVEHPSVMIYVPRVDVHVCLHLRRSCY